MPHTRKSIKILCVPCKFLTLKPIFHCDAKLLALGTFALPDAKDDTFASPDARIPTCWYLLLKVAFYPTRNPNASQWNIGCVGSLALGLCVGHVHFILFVLI